MHSQLDGPQRLLRAHMRTLRLNPFMRALSRHHFLLVNAVSTCRVLADRAAIKAYCWVECGLHHSM